MVTAPTFLALGKRRLVVIPRPSPREIALPDAPALPLRLCFSGRVKHCRHAEMDSPFDGRLLGGRSGAARDQRAG